MVLLALQLAQNPDFAPPAGMHIDAPYVVDTPHDIGMMTSLR